MEIGWFPAGGKNYPGLKVLKVGKWKSAERDLYPLEI